MSDGSSQSYDPRVTPVRPDLAADNLRGRVKVPRYASAVPHQVVRDGACLSFTPDANARQESQLLFGELFDVYDRNGDWCWGQNRADGYVGFVPASALSTDLHEPTHRVASRMLQLYPGPDLKLRAIGEISLGATVRVVDLEGSFAQIAGGQWLYAKHLVDLDFINVDLIGTALKFLGTPYVWGGRSAGGLDCSALLQLALCMAGERAPRDSDQLEKSVGVALPIADGHDFAQIQDGDMVFFPGHCGLFVHGWRFLHANAFDMEVSLHSFSDVIDRADASGEGVTSIRRFEPLYEG